MLLVVRLHHGQADWLELAGGEDPIPVLLFSTLDHSPIPVDSFERLADLRLCQVPIPRHQDLVDALLVGNVQPVPENLFQVISLERVVRTCLGGHLRTLFPAIGGVVVANEHLRLVRKFEARLEASNGLSERGFARGSRRVRHGTDTAKAWWKSTANAWPTWPTSGKDKRMAET